jgi:hypothetical protein
MNYNGSLEKKAQERVNELKKDYVIDMLTAERLQDIFVYLILAKASKNQRGVAMQEAALRNVLHNCLLINQKTNLFIPPNAVDTVNSQKSGLYL